MKVKIEDLKREVKKDFESYEEYITEYYNYQNYIDDIIHDIADNNVDIYNYDLLEWAKENYSYIEDYVKEFGIDLQNFDFIGIIRGGQYLYIEQTLYNNKESMLEYLAYYILNDKGIAEIEEEKATEISMINFERIETINELEEEINNILEEEEE